MKFLVTGGAGFIGSALCRHLVGATDAEADLRRLVADGVDALQGAGDRLGIADVADEPLGPGRDRAVGAEVEDAHGLAAREQGVDDVGADEPGSAGDEVQHGDGS